MNRKAIEICKKKIG